MFWMIAALLLALAAGFVCLPVLLGPRLIAREARPDHAQAIRRIHQQRIDELEAEVENADMREQMRDELSAVLLAEYPQTVQPRDKTVGPSRRVVWLAALLTSMLGLGVFVSVADPGVVTLRGAERLLQLTVEHDLPEIESWQHKLGQRVKQAPKDGKSWYLLGHAELKKGNFSAAAQAFATTNTLVENDLSVQVYWLQARYLAANGVLDQVSVDLAEKLLSQNPNMPVVLEILALHAFANDEKPKAIELLNRAITGSRDFEQQAVFGRAIADIRGGFENPPPGVGLDVKVAPEFAAQIPSSATLFVLARPVGGGMPYAVVRRPAALIPVLLQLDDLVTMSAQRSLSDAQTFEVVVRISASGTAMAAASDWQWISQPLSLAENAGDRFSVVLTPPTTH